MHTEPNIVVIEPDIDIISLKMLNVLGCDTTNVTFKVRRRLFGCCSESAKTSLTDSLSEIEYEDTQRSSKVWNFDFNNESPLPAGRYVWEKVRDCDVPVWYTSDKNVNDERLCIDNKVSEKDAKQSRDVNLQTADYKSTSYKGHNSHSNRITTKLVQTHIKGYAKIQKKRAPKRPCSKSSCLRFLRGPHRVANYILRNQDDSTVS